MGRRGFTLIELLLALAIATAVLSVVLGGVRVGIAAWTRGEERGARLDRARGIALLVESALEGAFPYRSASEEPQDGRVLFDGRPDGLVFATHSPPLPSATPVAFTVVGLSRDPNGLALRQQALPNRLALAALPPLLVDAETSAIRIRYLGAEPGAWQDEWSMRQERSLPRAVEITLVNGTSGSGGVELAIVAPIRTSSP